MKKFWKTFIALLIVFAMTFTMVALAACNPNNPSGPDADNSDNTGNNDNAGNTDNTGNGGSGFEFTGSTPEITALLNAMLSQKVSNVGLKINSTDSSKYTVYSVNNNGGVIREITDESFDYNLKTETDGKFNIANGDGEISNYEKKTNKIHSQNDYEKYDYTFIRDWNVFTVSGYDDKVLQKDLSWKYNLLDKINGEYYSPEAAIANAVRQLVNDTADADKIISKLLVPGAGFAACSIADSFGALTLENGKAVVDVNLAVYNMVQKVKTLLNSLDEDTTIGQLLADSTVKSLITAYTASLSVDDVHEYLLSLVDMEIIGGVTLGAELATHGITLSDYIVAPDANSTVYDYIVKIISSNGLKNLCTKIMKIVIGQDDISLPTTINNITVDFFVNMLFGLSIEEIKAEFNAAIKDITRTEILTAESSATYTCTVPEPIIEEGETVDWQDVEKTFNIPNSSNFSITNFKVEYYLNGNVVTGIKVTCNSHDWGAYVNKHIYRDGEESSQGNANVDVHYEFRRHVYNYIDSYNITIGFTDSDYLLTDISNETTECRVRMLSGGEYLRPVFIYGEEVGLDDGYIASILVGVEATADGKLKGVTLSYCSDFQPISVDKNGKFTVELIRSSDSGGEKVQKDLYLMVFNLETELRVFIATSPIAGFEMDYPYIIRRYFVPKPDRWGTCKVSQVLDGTFIKVITEDDSIEE